MKRFILATILSFITVQLSGALIAVLIRQPTVNQRLQPHIRSMQEGLNLGSLSLGYLILAAGITFVLPRFRYSGNWLTRSSMVD